MPISLESARLRLSSRLQVVDGAFERHRVGGVSGYRIDRSAFQEGLISALWQSWCLFCRTALVGSAQGATTAAGVATTSPYIGFPELEIAYVARQLGNKDAVGTVKALKGTHQEPTWGDAAKINLIAGGLGTSNSSTLLSSFGIASTIADLQLCRNACAHVGASLVADVSAARVRYSQTSFFHPSDMVFWVDPKTRRLLWKIWLADMRNIAGKAVR